MSLCATMEKERGSRRRNADRGEDDLTTVRLETTDHHEKRSKISYSHSNQQEDSEMGRITARSQVQLCGEAMTGAAHLSQPSLATNRGGHCDHVALPKTHCMAGTEQGSGTTRFHGAAASNSVETAAFSPTNPTAVNSWEAPAGSDQYDLRSDGCASGCSEKLKSIPMLPSRGPQCSIDSMNSRLGSVRLTASSDRCACAGTANKSSPSTVPSTNVDLRSDGSFSMPTAGDDLVQDDACGSSSGGPYCTGILTSPSTRDTHHEPIMPSSACGHASHDPDATIPKTVASGGDAPSCRAHAGGTTHSQGVVDGSQAERTTEDAIRNDNTTEETSAADRTMTTGTQNQTDHGKTVVQQEVPGTIQDVFNSMALNQSEVNQHVRVDSRRG